MSREISLSRGLITLVDDEDFERFGHFNWTAHLADKRALRRSYYATRTDYRVKPFVHYRLHRLVAGAPADMVVDHIDGDTLNNTRANLRLCTIKQNARNRSASRRFRDRLHGLTTVGHYKDGAARYRAIIRVDGKPYVLGHFRCQIEAARAYDAKAVELHGDFATLNFPEEHGRKARTKPINPEHFRLLPGMALPEGAEAIEPTSERVPVIPSFTNRIIEGCE